MLPVVVPHTTPVTPSIVATELVLELHAPPVEASLNGDEEPAQMVALPVIGNVPTVTVILIGGHEPKV